MHEMPIWVRNSTCVCAKYFHKLCFYRFYHPTRLSPNYVNAHLVTSVVNLSNGVLIALSSLLNLSLLLLLFTSLYTKSCTSSVQPWILLYKWTLNRAFRLFLSSPSITNVVYSGPDFFIFFLVAQFSVISNNRTVLISLTLITLLTFNQWTLIFYFNVLNISLIRG